MKFKILAWTFLAILAVSPIVYSYLRTSPCSTGLSWLIEMDNPFCRVHRAATIVENASIRKGMIVLDAGCGPGRVTVPLAINVGSKGEVVALDIQDGMLSQVKEKAKAANLTNITFVHAGLGEKKLGSDKFDRALLVTVLGEIPNKEAALKEIYDALKPDGILSVTEIIFDPDFQSRNSVLKLAKAVGFKEKERFGNCIAYTLNFEKQSNSANF